MMILSSLKSTILWWVAELLAKSGINWVRNKINNYENRELLRKLNITSEPDFVMKELVDKFSSLTLTLHLDSKIPIKLYPKKINGRLYVDNFDFNLDWEKTVEEVSKHCIFDIEKFGRSHWSFNIPISLDVLRNNLESYWLFDIKIIFQHELSRTFKAVNFKIKDFDRDKILKNKAS